MYVFDLRRFSHREREDESQRDSLHRGPDVLSGHADPNQSESTPQNSTNDSLLWKCLCENKNSTQAGL